MIRRRARFNRSIPARMLANSVMNMNLEPSNCEAQPKQTDGVAGALDYTETQLEHTIGVVGGDCQRPN